MNLSFLLGHEGHTIFLEDSFQSWIRWFGNFHLVFLHFPIALIVMTVISECFFLKSKKPFFEHASRFMLVSAAFATLPTVLTGLAFSYDVTYNGNEANIFWWHRFLGFFITGLAFVTVMLKEFVLRRKIKSVILYYLSLLVLFICVNTTSYLGGRMTFSFFRILPPFWVK